MGGFLRAVASATAATALAASGCGSSAGSPAPPASPASPTSSPASPAASPATSPTSPPPTSPSRPAPIGRPPTTPEERTSALIRPSVMYVEVEWRGYLRNLSSGQFWSAEPISFLTACTGFTVNPDGHVVTAGHCVDPGIEGASRAFFDEAIRKEQEKGNKKTKEQLDKEFTGNWVVEGEVAGTPPDMIVRVFQSVAPMVSPTDVFASPGPMGALPKFARVVSFEPTSKGDVALLKVDGEDLPSVELSPERTVEIGTPVLAIGYPGFERPMEDRVLEPTNKDGKVSAKITSKGVPLYEISAAISQGMSGGPAVETASAKAMGLLTFKIDNEQQFNFVAPSSLIREILARNGVKNEQGALDRLYRAALEDYWAGDYPAAMRGFDAVLVRMPSHRQAWEYRAMAAERMAARPGRPAPS
ncbi:serine protease [Streptosporangium roseum]|uniref:serine protease n=1 Tax=Streptosporangium roseum TaxID=2001 RepID=UPI0033330A91